MELYFYPVPLELQTERAGFKTDTMEVVEEIDKM